MSQHPQRERFDERPMLAIRGGGASGPSSVASCCISNFDNLYAAGIASWVRGERELTWLAPGTVPPLTAAKVAAWAGRAGERLLFWKRQSVDPVGYAELNLMPSDSDQWWIGHCVIDPATRGQGYGQRFVQALLWRAFEVLEAGEVVLVVFPDNPAAIRCYRQNGMTITGREQKHFKTTRRRHEFLRMGIERRRFRGLLAAGHWSEPPAPFVDDLARFHGDRSTKDHTLSST